MTFSSSTATNNNNSRGIFALERIDSLYQNKTNNAKLYGRSKEQNRIHDAYIRMKEKLQQQQLITSTSSSSKSNTFFPTKITPEVEVVVIHGKSGVGKTRLAKSIQYSLVQTSKTTTTTITTATDNDDGYFFLSGTFRNNNSINNEPQRSASSNTFHIAFKSIVVDAVQTILKKKKLQQILQQTLASNGRLYQQCVILSKTIPELRQLLLPTEINKSNNLEQWNDVGSCIDGSSSSTSTSRIDGNSLRNAFHTFVLHGLCSLKYPIVIVFDDLQYATSVELKCIYAILFDTRTIGIMFILNHTTRRQHLNQQHTQQQQQQQHSSSLDISERTSSSGNTKTNTNSGFTTERWLNLIERSCSIVYTSIHLQNLDESSVTRVVTEVLTESRWTSRFSSILYKYTKGNVLFVLEYLRFIILEVMKQQQQQHNDDFANSKNTLDINSNNIESFDIPNEEWQSNLLQVLNKYQWKSFIELIQYRISKLSSPDQEILKIASCLGSNIDSIILRQVLPDRPMEFDDPLACYGLFGRHRCSDDDNHDDNNIIEEECGPQHEQQQQNCQENSSYRFLHDNIYEAVYRFIPEIEREQYHYWIGKRLWRRLNRTEKESSDDHSIFIVVNQFTRIKPTTFASHEEIVSVATIYLEAGIRSSGAAGSSGSCGGGYESSYYYFCKGIELLGSNGWQYEYRLCLTLHNHCAEAAYSCGMLQQARQLVQDIIHKAHTYDDTMIARITQVYTVGSNGSPHLAIMIGIEFLNQLGLKNTIVLKPSLLYVYYKMKQLKRRVQKMSIRTIVHKIPIMINDKRLAIMQMLNVLFFNTFVIDINTCHIVGMQMVLETITYGTCPISCLAFTIFGTMILGMDRDFQEGIRLGQISRLLYNKFQESSLSLSCESWLARFSAFHYSSLDHWTNRHLYEMMDELQVGYRTGIITGDIECALLCTITTMSYEFEYRTCTEMIRRYKDLIEQTNFYGQESIGKWPTLTYAFLVRLTSTSGNTSTDSIELSTYDDTNPFLSSDFKLDNNNFDDNDRFIQDTKRQRRRRRRPKHDNNTDATTTTKTRKNRIEDNHNNATDNNDSNTNNNNNDNNKKASVVNKNNNNNSNTSISLVFHTTEMIVLFLFGNYEKAYEESLRCRPIADYPFCANLSTWILFIEALIHIYVFTRGQTTTTTTSSSNPTKNTTTKNKRPFFFSFTTKMKIKKKKKNVVPRRAILNYKTLKKWTSGATGTRINDDNTTPSTTTITMVPPEFYIKILLLEAEIEGIRQHHDSAMVKFTKAIELSKQNQFLFLTAVGTELYGQYLSYIGQRTHSLKYLKEACNLYTIVNVPRKVSLLTNEIQIVTLLSRNE